MGYDGRTKKETEPGYRARMGFGGQGASIGKLAQGMDACNQSEEKASLGGGALGQVPERLDGPHRRLPLKHTLENDLANTEHRAFQLREVVGRLRSGEPLQWDESIVIREMLTRLGYIC